MILPFIMLAQIHYDFDKQYQKDGSTAFADISVKRIEPFQ